MKMFCAPTDKTEERCQKAAECGLLAVLAPFVSGGAGIFEISTYLVNTAICIFHADVRDMWVALRPCAK